MWKTLKGENFIVVESYVFITELAFQYTDYSLLSIFCTESGRPGRDALIRGYQKTSCIWWTWKEYPANQENSWALRSEGKVFRGKQWSRDLNESDLRSNEHYLSSSENKAWKKFRPVRDSNPWPLRHRCNAPPTEPTSTTWAVVKIRPWSRDCKP